MSATPKSLGIITVAAAGTPVALSATPVTTKKFWATGIKSVGPTVNNAGVIYLIPAGGTRATAVRIVAAGATADMDRPRSTGEQHDLSLWTVDADNACDGVLIGYLGE